MTSTLNKIGKDIKGIMINVRGASRGICMIWNHTIIAIQNTHWEKHWVNTDFKNEENGKTFIIYNIYGMAHYKDKEKF